MGLLSKLKSVLGLDSDEDDRVGRQSTDVGVTVERERDEADTETEAAVKGVETTETDEETVESNASTEPDDSTESDAGGEAEPEPATEAEPDESDASAETEAGPDDTTDTETEESTASDGEDVQDIKGIGPAYADRLAEVGIETIADLAAADHETVAEEADLAPGRVEQWVDRAKARQ